MFDTTTPIKLRGPALAVVMMIVAAGTLLGQNVAVPDIQSSVSTVFGTYTPYTPPKHQVRAGLSEATVAGDFSNVATVESSFPWREYFTASERSILQKNNLVARPEAFANFGQAYSRALMTTELGTFVTVDAITHGLRVTLDEATRTIERDHAAPTLATVLGDLSRSLTSQVAVERDPGVGEALLRLLAYVQTAESLLDPMTVTHDRVRSIVAVELEKIQAAQGVAQSSVFPSRRLDYSQFAPTGYYAQDSRLANFYRARTWLGGIGFELRSADGSVDVRDARMAVLLARTMDLLSASGDFRQRYQSVVDPLAFLHGRTGPEINWDMIAGSIRGYYGRLSSTGTGIFAEDNALVTFVEYVHRELPQEIASSRQQSFRLLGRPVDAGSALLEALQSQGGMTIMATLGSQRAAGLSSGRNETVRAFLGAHGARMPLENWMQDLDHALLYTLHPLLDNEMSRDVYPRFMRSDAWRDRSLGSAIGAWVSYQHPVATMTMRQTTTATAFGRRSGGDLESDGYVEPNPEAWSRLASLAAYLRGGLVEGEYGSLIGPKIEAKLRDIENTSAELMRIAAAELEGRELTDAQMQLIGSIGNRIAAYEVFTDRSLADKGSAVSAGVAGGNTANGHPIALYVIVPRNDGLGGLMLTRGAVYSYYTTDAAEDAFRRSLTTDNGTVRPDMQWMNSYLSSDRSFAQDASKFRAVNGELPALTAYVPTKAERNRALPNIVIDMESNVVRRSAGEFWFTVRAPRLDGSDIVFNVVNSSGQVVHRSYPVRIENGERYDMVPLENLQSGQYFLRVTDGLERTLASGRFMVVR